MSQNEKCCTLCGATAKLTKHHIDGVKNGGPSVWLCEPCHDKEHGVVRRERPDRLLKRGLRFTEQSLKLIRPDSRWVHIADKWTDGEKKEMLEYLTAQLVRG